MNKLIAFLVTGCISFNSFAIETIPFLKPIDVIHIRTQVTLDTPLTFMEGPDVGFWTQLSMLLYNTKNTDILLRIEGVGGIALVANTFIKAIQAAQRQGSTVTMDIIGPAYSAHAFIVCAADKFILEDGASLMFHPVGGYTSFMGLEYRQHANDLSSINMQNYMLRMCKAKGILTDSEIRAINNGQSVTISRSGDTLIRTIGDDVGMFLNELFPYLLLALGLCTFMLVSLLLTRRFKYV